MGRVLVESDVSAVADCNADNVRRSVNSIVMVRYVGMLQSNSLLLCYLYESYLM